MAQVTTINLVQLVASVGGSMADAVVGWGQSLVYRRQAKTNAYVSSLRLGVSLCRMVLVLEITRWVFNAIRIGLARLDSKTEEDREKLHGFATKWGGQATQFYTMHDKWSEVLPLFSKKGPRIGRLSSTISRQIEGLGVLFEDTSETLALAASDEFRQLVRQELNDTRCPPVEGSGTM